MCQLKFCLSGLCYNTYHDVLPTIQYFKDRAKTGMIQINTVLFEMSFDLEQWDIFLYKTKTK